MLLKGNAVQLVLLTLSGIFGHIAMILYMWLPAAQDAPVVIPPPVPVVIPPPVPVVTQGADVREAALALDDAVRDDSEVARPTRNAVRKQGFNGRTNMGHRRVRLVQRP
jgi:hypothetical protein